MLLENFREMFFLILIFDISKVVDLIEEIVVKLVIKLGQKLLVDDGTTKVGIYLSDSVDGYGHPGCSNFIKFYKKSKSSRSKPNILI